MNLGVNFYVKHNDAYATQWHPADRSDRCGHGHSFCAGPAVPSGTPAPRSHNMCNPWSKAGVRWCTNWRTSVAQRTKIAGHRQGTFVSTASLGSLCTLQLRAEPSPTSPTFPNKASCFITRKDHFLVASRGSKLGRCWAFHQRTQGQCQRKCLKSRYATHRCSPTTRNKETHQSNDIYTHNTKSANSVPPRETLVLRDEPIT